MDSPKADLNKVALVMIETRAIELAQLALDDCLKKADFGEVILCTHNQGLRCPGAWHRHVDDYNTKREFLEFCMYDIADGVNSDNILYVEWDSGIFAPQMWKPEFLNFDFIGAPWWYTDGHNVGNGGFSLRSVDLVRYLSKHRDKHPVTSAAADDLLCRSWRPALEAEGFRWAGEDLAMDFAFECVRRSRDSLHFGYHALRNWRYVYSGDELQERLQLAAKNPYIKGTGMLDQYWAGAGVHKYLEDA